MELDRGHSTRFSAGPLLDVTDRRGAEANAPPDLRERPAGRLQFANSIRPSGHSATENTEFRSTLQRHTVTEFRNLSPMTTLGARIRAVREERGFEPKELAQRAGLAYSTLMDIENGRQASSTKLHSIASVLRVHARWLETGRGHRDLDEGDDYDAPWGDVLAYPQAVGLGAGKEAQEYAETHKLKFRAESLHRAGLSAEHLSIYYGHGDSMEPIIRDGDAVMVDESDKEVVDGEMYLILWRGEYYVKQADVRDDIVYFESVNEAGDHNWRKAKRMDSKVDPIEVIGRVCWTATWHGKSRRRARSAR